MLSHEDVWKQVVDNLRQQVVAETFTLWIQPLKPISLADEKLVLQVPNKYFSDWIKNHQQENIEKILKDVVGQNIKIEYQEAQDLTSILKKVEDIQSPDDAPISVKAPGDDHLNSKYTFDRFVVGASNRFAHASCEAVAKDPGRQFNPLFIYGGVGLGKTHLLHAIGNHIKKNNPSLRVLYVSSGQFINEFIDSLRFEKPASFRNKYRNLDCLLIDDIQFLIGKQSSQEEFFFTFNTLYDSKKQVVITSDRPPKELPTLEPRLISRFEWGVIADIQPPDLETRIAILRKKAEEERLYIPDDVVLYIATQIKSNIRELEGSLLRITAFSAFTGTPLTVDSVQKILKDVVRPPEDTAPITIDRIQKVVAKHFNLEVKDMKSKRRTDAVAFPRQIAMYLARTLTDEFSTTEIGEAFGGKDHTTVMHACNKIKAKMSSDPYFVAKVNQISQEIRAGKEE
ncbi:MAG: chromosomal replication initiation protein DnaA [Elusimicrobia bacterium RIFOXYA1_FULL_47_7]|nr:MAG: chromosomal replication initiation protein DnaA [Elusimicrobia bacterium RIFOXYA12_FULL_49_49]OGS09748.1 MAG: chromosomal replication initiation protein DnaA [Elusimicrobia bacterium RIFOXYA1_FULL_47_7]OGS10771.1 MAG: chromosomal replication initiation protein DnaA [Elusimicrobia bacterium RIFOXYB1_FULL_48_9]OGS16485.1 MAG: chromosomal replication initiation protein DnaA [Elusimicrobia bacterium RIFOXYA2_FULL_47_53]OGS26661.1 MAG: chromosomal replication initiation protein DnaA [Elusimi